MCLVPIRVARTADDAGAVQTTARTELKMGEREKNKQYHSRPRLRVRESLPHVEWILTGRDGKSHMIKRFVLAGETDQNPIARAAWCSTHTTDSPAWQGEVKDRSRIVTLGLHDSTQEASRLGIRGKRKSSRGYGSRQAQNGYVFGDGWIRSGVGGQEMDLPWRKLSP